MTIKKNADFKELTKLGAGKSAKPSKILEAFPNRTPERYYLVKLETSEFTCVCPKTGQPDFAKLTIWYVPDKKIVESKSLKLYFWSYRNEGVFHEHLINRILDDLVKALDPHFCVVKGIFNARGGIGIDVIAEHVKSVDAKSIWNNYCLRGGMENV